LKIDAVGLLQSIGIDPSILKSPDEQIAVETYIAIENEAARISGDPFFGLHMGEFFEPGNYSILGYVMMNSRKLGEAFEKAARYHKIIGNMISPAYQIGFRKVKIILTAPKLAPKFSRHCFETAISSQVTIMRKITGRRIDGGVLPRVPLSRAFRAETRLCQARYAHRGYRLPARLFRCQCLQKSL
jgi:hypothetical protein